MQLILGGTLVMVAAIAWSTAGLFTRVVTTDIPTTLFGRSISGGLCVLAIYAILSRSDKSELLKFTKAEVLIALISAAGMMCFISAFFYTSIANVTFIYGLMPLVTLLLSVLVLKSAPTTTGILCCIAASVGVFIIFWSEAGSSNMMGLLLAFGMTFFMSALTVAAKLFPKADVTKATYLSALLAAAIMLPMSTLDTVTATDAAWLLAYGIVNVGFGFGVYLLGVTRISALAAALIGLIEIPLAPLWAFLIFDEDVAANTLFGGVVVMLAAGFYIIISRDRKRTEKNAS